MKRKMCGMMLITLMLFVLSGCRMYADYTVNDNGTVTSKAKIAYSPEEIEYMQATGDTSIDVSEMTLETLEDGKQYYVTPEEVETQDLATVNENEVTLSEHIFYYPIGIEGQNVDVSMLMYMQVSVSLLEDIVDTNADLSVEGNTAVFSSDGKMLYWYAYTQTGKEMIAADSQAPKMKGAKNKKYYKKMPANIQFTDNIAVKEVKLNGQPVQPVSNTSVVDGKATVETMWVNSSAKDASKNGKNVFKVTDLKGNTSTFTIYVDKKVPTVKGVKNKKTYKKKAVVYIKDNLKLSKITINGKKQKMTQKQLVKKGKYKGYYKYTIKKKGTNRIVIKDAAGNKKTLQIKIKK